MRSLQGTKPSKCGKGGAKGRTYIKGRALSDDFRKSIVDKLVRNGGDVNTRYFLEVVWKKVWNRLHTESTVQPKQHGGGNPSNLTRGDLQLIETWKKARPTSSLREIHDVVNKFGDILNGTLISAILRSLRRNMLSGLNYTRKKISSIPQERFTIENMAYTHMFIDYLRTKTLISFLSH